MELLQALQIEKKYPTKDDLLFQEVQFSVHSEEGAVEADHIGLIGDNGSGKSTLLKIIGNTIAPDQGRIEYKKDGLSFHRGI